MKRYFEHDIRKTCLTALMVLVFSICTGSVSGIGEMLLPPEHESAIFLATFKGKPAELDPRIDELRSAIRQPNANKHLRTELAAFIVKKISIMAKPDYNSIEHLFFEASDLVPGSWHISALWGQTLYAAGNYESALTHFEDAYYANQSNHEIKGMIGITYHKLMQYEPAVDHLEAFLLKEPKNFFILYTLGACYFELKDYEYAIQRWEEALTLATNDNDAEAIRNLINKAKEMEASTSGGTIDENQKFVVHFAGNSQDDIGDTVMEILEEVYYQVTCDLMYNPDIKINVIFFRTEDFYSVNQLGDWVGAVARGATILVPLIQGYRNVNNIKGILAHEFTHVIVNLRTNNRCPVWINEGLAVYQEFRSMFGDPEVMRSDYQRLFDTEVVGKHNFVRFNQINLDPSRQTYGMSVPLGYLTSYLAIRFLIERWGFQGVDYLLATLGEGERVDEALLEATGLNLKDFESEFHDWLRSF